MQVNKIGKTDKTNKINKPIKCIKVIKLSNLKMKKGRVIGSNKLMSQDCPRCASGVLFALRGFGKRQSCPRDCSPYARHLT